MITTCSTHGLHADRAPDTVVSSKLPPNGSEHRACMAIWWDADRTTVVGFCVKTLPAAKIGVQLLCMENYRVVMECGFHIEISKENGLHTDQVAVN